LWAKVASTGLFLYTHLTEQATSAAAQQAGRLSPLCEPTFSERS